MANQRMGLKCSCGAQIYFAKRFGDGFYTQPAVPPEKFDAWLSEHAWCTNTQDHFGITYEHERDYDSKRMPLDPPRMPSE